MNLTELSLKRPVAVSVIFFGLLSAGLYSFLKSPVALTPVISLPSVIVAVSYPQASPDKVENDITAPLEKHLNQLSGIKDIYSFSRENESIIILNFRWKKKTVEALRETKEILRKIELPRGAYSPVVRRWSASEKPVMRIDFTSENTRALQNWVERSLKPEIERIRGVNKAEMSGESGEEIMILVSPSKLSSYGIGIDELVKQIKACNLSVQAGRIESESREYIVRVAGKLKSPADLRDIPILGRHSQIYLLREIADIRTRRKSDGNFARLDGKSSLALAIIQDTDANTLTIINKVKKVLDKIKTTIPQGVSFAVTSDDSVYIKDSQALLQSNIFLGTAIVALVLFAFLKNFRYTLVIGASIPFSVLPAFIILRIAGITQNVLSLAGLALGIGMVLDASIVVLENIHRHFSLSSNSYSAALSGTIEVRKSVIASCLTTLAVFVPILTLEGLAGELFGDLSMAVVSLLVFSLFVSFALVPLLTVKNLKAVPPPVPGKRKNSAGSGIYGRIMSLYSSLVEKICADRKTRFSIVAVTFILCVISFLKLPPAVFIPEGREREVRISVTMPQGTSLAAAENYIASIERAAVSPAVSSIVSKGNSIKSEVTALLKPYKIREFVSVYIKDLLGRLEKLPEEGEISVSRVDMITSAGGLGKPLEIKVMGRDWNEIETAARRVRDHLINESGLMNLSSFNARQKPGIEFRMSRSALSRYNLSAEKAAEQISAYVSGKDSGKIAGEDLKVICSDTARSAGDILNLPLVPEEGGSVNLSAVAEPLYSETRQEAEHYNSMRAVTMTADISPGAAMGEVLGGIKKKLARESAGSGIMISVGGVAGNMVESFSQLKGALLISLFLLYVIMAAQFESLIFPFVIMSTIPLTAIGISIGLAVTGENLSVSALIGIIMLAGIVVNNGIVLIDFINILRDRGFERNEAIKRTGMVRLRPILMTSVTTIAGMLPMVAGIGSGSELYRGLAVTVSFGLFFSTFLTLIIVPAVYLIFDDIGEMAGVIKLKLFFSGKRLAVGG